MNNILNSTKLCILAAGTGSRLGSLSENLGKALLPIGNTTALSTIINKFPKEYEIILALGYKADLVESYCKAVHQDRNITFVYIDNFDKPGSGPGYSLLQCKPFIGSNKFYLSTVDCLFDEDVPELNYDWIGTSKTDNPKLYSTAQVDDQNNILKFINKNPQGYDNAFIGIAYIHTPSVFWSSIDKYRSSEKEVEFVAGWYDPQLYDKFVSVGLTWNDTGSIEGYNETLSKYGYPSLGMSKIITEHTFFENRTIVKISNDKLKNDRRYSRAFDLRGLVPDIKYKSDNLIAYDWVDGVEMYQDENPECILDLLTWLQDNLWKSVSDLQFNKLCYEFYHDKTYQRYEKINFVKDDVCFINGMRCLPVGEILASINFDEISQGVPVKFHGDLQFQNIIFNNGKFTLIDWREDFSGNSQYGDIYYDLSKLYACLNFDYSLIDKFSWTIQIKDNYYDYSVETRNSLLKALSIYETWINENNFDLDKIRVLSALIWLNMSPLHTYPDNLILFLHSKYYLNSIMNSNSYFQID